MGQTRSSVGGEGKVDVNLGGANENKRSERTKKKVAKAKATLFQRWLFFRHALFPTAGRRSFFFCLHFKPEGNRVPSR